MNPNLAESRLIGEDRGFSLDGNDNGKLLRGAPPSHADFSATLLPLPRTPVALAVWASDDEPSANASLLMDSTCARHMPLDILCSVAMMRIQIMLRSLEQRIWPASL